jgi:hypothetical protein
MNWYQKSICLLMLRSIQMDGVLRHNAFSFIEREELIGLNVPRRLLLSAWPYDVKVYDLVGLRFSEAECDWQFAL